MPRVGGVIGTHNVPVLLHEQDVRAGRVHGDSVNTMPDFCVGIGQLVGGFQPAIHRLPTFAAVIGAKGAGCRNGDENSLGPFGIENDRMETHAACSRLPEMALGGAQSGQLLPAATSVHRFEEPRVLHTRVNGVRIGRRGFEVPDTFELPRVLGAVVPLMSAGYAVVLKLATSGLPGFSAVVGALDHLAEPTTGLRRVQTIRLCG